MHVQGECALEENTCSMEKIDSISIPKRAGMTMHAIFNTWSYWQLAEHTPLQFSIMQLLPEHCTLVEQIAEHGPEAGTKIVIVHLGYAYADWLQYTASNARALSDNNLTLNLDICFSPSIADATLLVNPEIILDIILNSIEFNPSGRPRTKS